MSSTTLVILNPASAAGATGRNRAGIRDTIESALGELDVEVTRAPEDAERLARAATERGVSRILVAGGDGTTSGIARGVLAAEVDAAARPALGLLPLGSGCDLARSLGLPRDLDAALRVIAQDRRRRIDAGRLTFRDSMGRETSSCFVNEASAGLSGATVRIVGSLTKRLGPRLAFGAGAIAAILSHRPIEAAVEVDGERIYEGPVSMIVAANGRYFGAGMKVAPRARVDDGALEAVLVRGLSVPRLLWNLPSFYVGRHAGHPQVSFHAARCLEILPKASGAPIDLDGESVGGLPMRAEVLPGALELFAPPVVAHAGER